MAKKSQINVVASIEDQANKLIAVASDIKGVRPLKDIQKDVANITKERDVLRKTRDNLIGKAKDQADVRLKEINKLLNELKDFQRVAKHIADAENKQLHLVNRLLSASSAVGLVHGPYKVGSVVGSQPNPKAVAKTQDMQSMVDKLVAQAMPGVDPGHFPDVINAAMTGGDFGALASQKVKELQAAVDAKAKREAAEVEKKVQRAAKRKPRPAQTMAAAQARANTVTPPKPSRRSKAGGWNSKKAIPKLPIGSEERRWAAMPEEVKDRPSSVEMGDSLSETKTKKHTLQADRFEGGVENHKIREAISKELTKLIGKPEQSSLSEAQYFATENGRQIRVANHGESYHFEDSGLNIVPGNTKASHLPIPPGSWVDPKAVAKIAVKENSKLPQLDLEGFNKRMEWRQQNSDWHQKRTEHRNSVLPDLLNKKVSLADLRSQHKALGLPVSEVGYKTKANYATRIADHLFEKENPKPLMPTASVAAPPQEPPKPPLKAPGSAGDAPEDKPQDVVAFKKTLTPKQKREFNDIVRQEMAAAGVEPLAVKGKKDYDYKKGDPNFAKALSVGESKAMQRFGTQVAPPAVETAATPVVEQSPAVSSGRKRTRKPAVESKPAIVAPVAAVEAVDAGLEGVTKSFDAANAAKKKFEENLTGVFKRALNSAVGDLGKFKKAAKETEAAVGQVATKTADTAKIVAKAGNQVKEKPSLFMKSTKDVLGIQDEILGPPAPPSSFMNATKDFTAGVYKTPLGPPKPAFKPPTKAEISAAAKKTPPVFPVGNGGINLGDPIFRGPPAQPMTPALTQRSEDEKAERRERLWQERHRRLEKMFFDNRAAPEVDAEKTLRSEKRMKAQWEKRDQALNATNSGSGFSKPPSKPLAPAGATGDSGYGNVPLEDLLHYKSRASEKIALDLDNPGRSAPQMAAEVAASVQARAKKLAAAKKKMAGTTESGSTLTQAGYKQEILKHLEAGVFKKFAISEEVATKTTKNEDGTESSQVVSSYATPAFRQAVMGLLATHVEEGFQAGWNPQAKIKAAKPAKAATPSIASVLHGTRPSQVVPLPVEFQQQIESSGNMLRKDEGEINVGKAEQKLARTAEASVRRRGKRMPIEPNWLLGAYQEAKEQIENLKLQGNKGATLLKAAAAGMASGAAFSEISKVARTLEEKMVAFGSSSQKTEGLLSDIKKKFIDRMVDDFDHTEQEAQDLFSQIKPELETSIAGKVNQAKGKLYSRLSQTSMGRELHSRIDMRGLYGQEAIEEGRRFRREKLQDIGGFAGLGKEKAEHFGSTEDQAYLVDSIFKNRKQRGKFSSLSEAVQQTQARLDWRESQLQSSTAGTGMHDVTQKRVDRLRLVLDDLKKTESLIGKLENEMADYSDPLTKSRNLYQTMRQELYRNMSGSITGAGELGSSDKMKIYDDVLAESENTTSLRETRAKFTSHRIAGGANGDAFIKQMTEQGILDPKGFTAASVKPGGNIQKVSENLKHSEIALIAQEQKLITAFVGSIKGTQAERDAEDALRKVTIELASNRKAQAHAAAAQDVNGPRNAEEEKAELDRASSEKRRQKIATLNKPKIEKAEKDLERILDDRQKVMEKYANSGWLGKKREDIELESLTKQESEARNKIGALQGNRGGKQPRYLNYAIPQLAYGVEDFMQVLAAGQSPLRAFLGAANNIGPAMALMGIGTAKASIAVAGLLSVAYLFQRGSKNTKKDIDQLRESIERLGDSMGRIEKARYGFQSSGSLLGAAGKLPNRDIFKQAQELRQNVLPIFSEISRFRGFSNMEEMKSIGAKRQNDPTLGWSGKVFGGSDFTVGKNSYAVPGPGELASAAWGKTKAFSSVVSRSMFGNSTGRRVSKPGEFIREPLSVDEMLAEREPQGGTLGGVIGGAAGLIGGRVAAARAVSAVAPVGLSAMSGTMGRLAIMTAGATGSLARMIPMLMRLRLLASFTPMGLAANVGLTAAGYGIGSMLDNKGGVSTEAQRQLDTQHTQQKARYQSMTDLGVYKKLQDSIRELDDAIKARDEAVKNAARMPEDYLQAMKSADSMERKFGMVGLNQDLTKGLLQQLVEAEENVRAADEDAIRKLPDLKEKQKQLAREVAKLSSGGSEYEEIRRQKKKEGRSAFEADLLAQGGTQLDKQHAQKQLDYINKEIERVGGGPGAARTMRGATEKSLEKALPQQGEGLRHLLETIEGFDANGLVAAWHALEKSDHVAKLLGERVPQMNQLDKALLLHKVNLESVSDEYAKQTAELMKLKAAFNEKKVATEKAGGNLSQETLSAEAIKSAKVLGIELTTLQRAMGEAELRSKKLSQEVNDLFAKRGGVPKEIQAGIDAEKLQGNIQRMDNNQFLSALSALNEWAPSLLTVNEQIQLQIKRNQQLNNVVSDVDAQFIGLTLEMKKAGFQVRSIGGDLAAIEERRKVFLKIPGATDTQKAVFNAQSDAAAKSAVLNSDAMQTIRRSRGGYIEGSVYNTPNGKQTGKQLNLQGTLDTLRENLEIELTKLVPVNGESESERRLKEQAASDAKSEHQRNVASAMDNAYGFSQKSGTRLMEPASMWRAIQESLVDDPSLAIEKEQYAVLKQIFQAIKDNKIDKLPAAQKAMAKQLMGGNAVGLNTNVAPGAGVDVGAVKSKIKPENFNAVLAKEKKMMAQKTAADRSRQRMAEIEEQGKGLVFAEPINTEPLQLVVSKNKARESELKKEIGLPGTTTEEAELARQEKLTLGRAGSNKIAVWEAQERRKRLQSLVDDSDTSKGRPTNSGNPESQKAWDIKKAQQDAAAAQKKLDAESARKKIQDTERERLNKEYNDKVNANDPVGANSAKKAQLEFEQKSFGDKRFQDQIDNLEKMPEKWNVADSAVLQQELPAQTSYLKDILETLMARLPSVGAGGQSVSGVAQGGVIDARDTVNVKVRPGEGIFTPTQMQRMASRMGVGVNEMLSDARVPGFAQGGRWGVPRHVLARQQADARQAMLKGRGESRDRYFESIRNRLADRKNKIANYNEPSAPDVLAKHDKRNENLARGERLKNDTQSRRDGFNDRADEIARALRGEPRPQFPSRKEESSPFNKNVASIAARKKEEAAARAAETSKRIDSLNYRKEAEAQKRADATRQRIEDLKSERNAKLAGSTPESRMAEMMEKNKTRRDSGKTLDNQVSDTQYSNPFQERLQREEDRKNKPAMYYRQGKATRNNSFMEQVHGNPSASVARENALNARITKKEADSNAALGRAESFRGGPLPGSTRYRAMPDMDRVRREQEAAAKKRADAQAQRDVDSVPDPTELQKNQRLNNRNRGMQPSFVPGVSNPYDRNQASFATPKISSSVADNVGSNQMEKLQKQQIEKLDLIAGYTGAANSISSAQTGAILGNA